MKSHILWAAAAVVVALGTIPVSAATAIEDVGGGTLLSHAEMNLIAGGGTASCTDCLLAAQCDGEPTACGQSFCLLNSCSPAHDYSSFNDCHGDSPSDCTYISSVPCTWDVSCYCGFFFTCSPLGSKTEANSVESCG